MLQFSKFSIYFFLFATDHTNTDQETYSFPFFFEVSETT
jgi:hypothetical protein